MKFRKGPKYQRGIIIATAVFAKLVDPLSVSAGNNVSTTGSGMSMCGNPGITGLTAAVGSGGVPPYTFKWTIDDTPATKGPWVPLDDTDPTTTFSGSTNVCTGEDFDEIWEVEITDDNLDTAVDTLQVRRRWVDIS